MQYFSSRSTVSELRTPKFFHGRSEPSPKHCGQHLFNCFSSIPGKKWCENSCAGPKNKEGRKSPTFKPRTTEIMTFTAVCKWTFWNLRTWLCFLPGLSKNVYLANPYLFFPSPFDNGVNLINNLPPGLPLLTALNRRAFHCGRRPRLPGIYWLESIELRICRLTLHQMTRYALHSELLLVNLPKVSLVKVVGSIRKTEEFHTSSWPMCLFSPRTPRICPAHWCSVFAQ